MRILRNVLHTCNSDSVRNFLRCASLHTVYVIYCARFLSNVLPERNKQRTARQQYSSSQYPCKIMHMSTERAKNLVRYTQ